MTQHIVRGRHKREIMSMSISMDRTVVNYVRKMSEEDGRTMSGWLNQQLLILMKRDNPEMLENVEPSIAKKSGTVLNLKKKG